MGSHWPMPCHTPHAAWPLLRSSDSSASAPTARGSETERQGDCCSALSQSVIHANAVTEKRARPSGREVVVCLVEAAHAFMLQIEAFMFRTLLTV